MSPDITVGINGFTLNGRSEFDGNDPFTFARSHDLSTRFSLAAAAIAASLSLVAGAQQPPASPAPIYTDAQAQRGEELYAKRCGQCHGADLTGMPLP